jgi:hypothetical protein
MQMSGCNSGRYDQFSCTPDAHFPPTRRRPFSMDGRTWKWTTKSYAAEYCELSADLRDLTQPKLLMSVLRPTGKVQESPDIPYSMLKVHRRLEQCRRLRQARRRAGSTAPPTFVELTTVPSERPPVADRTYLRAPYPGEAIRNQVVPAILRTLLKAHEARSYMPAPGSR